MTRERLANDIWRACDIMRRDNNCGGAMEYLEHLTWLLFLKFIDEPDPASSSSQRRSHRNSKLLIDGKYRWSAWTEKALGRKAADGVRRGSPMWNDDQLMSYLRNDLLPYLASLAGSPEHQVVAGIFNGRTVVLCASPQNLREVLSIIDGIHFENEDDIHTVSSVYEELLRKLGRENKLAGEFYTPRAIARFMVDVIEPRIGETVYDPACGTCGLLVEALEYMRKAARTPKDERRLQQQPTFFGNEKKPVPALLGLVHMLLRGATVPQIRRCNTLEQDSRTPSALFDVVLSNPPFGGTENIRVQQNFQLKANATELLFLEHIMNKLKRSGHARCALVVPEGTLFRGGAFARARQELLNNYDLFMVVSLPPGAFAPYSNVKTSLLFFERGGPTREVLYQRIEARPGQKGFNKNTPLSDEHFELARATWNGWASYRRGAHPRPAATGWCWIESYREIEARGFDLSSRKPEDRSQDEIPNVADLTARLLASTSDLHQLIQRLHKKLSARVGL
ncbi:N-6 DNA methylase [Archangium gephyra]|nr:class I SAM-dependent DNA methyltransferase [Archangium gephyra]